jgi:hypothetical protein
MKKNTVGVLPLRKNGFTRFIVERQGLIVEIIAALFILLFTYTALSKLFEYNSFKNVLSKSPLIGSFSPIIAIALPVIELVVSILLFIPVFKKVGLYGSLGLMILFTGYLGYMIMFTPNRPCSCGGILRQMTWTQHLIFNILFTLLAWIGIRLSSKLNK